MQNKKVILTANSSWYLYNFKIKLINNLIKEGFSNFVAPFDKYTKLFGEEIDFRIVH